MMGGLFGMKGLYLLKQKASGEGKSGDLSMQAIIHIISGGFSSNSTAVIGFCQQHLINTQGIFHA
jgi:hypothetical protein